MDINAILIATALIVLHGVDGDLVMVNPKHITTLHPTRDRNLGTRERLMAGGVNCVVGFVSAKFISVTEDCATVRKLMEEAK